jgi:anti-sigma factor RsiW
MTCRDVIEFLMDYLAGEVSPEERAVFEQHLAICPPCVAYLKTYQETIQLEQSVLSQPEEPICEEIPDDLVQAIMAARKKST